MSLAISAVPSPHKPRGAAPSIDAETLERARHVECLVGIAYGVPARYYAEKYGVSVRTIFNWRDRARGYFRGVAS